MSEWPARDKLITELRRSGTGHTGMVAAELVFAYAHELAEKIRNEPTPDDPDGYGGFVGAGADWAADLIDPAVS